MKNRVFDGKGKYVSKTAGSYKGEWKNGKQHGWGVVMNHANRRY